MIHTWIKFWHLSRVKRVALLNIWSLIMYMDTVLEWNYCTFCALQIVHFVALWKGTKSNGTTTKSYSLSRSSPKDFLIAKIQAIWLIHAKDEVNLWANPRKSCMITIVTPQIELIRMKYTQSGVQLRGNFRERKE